MRLSTEVRDVSPDRAAGAGRGRIAIASESKQAGGVSRRPGALKSYYPRPHTRRAPHTSFECASLWRRPGPCMILVRVRLISGRLNLTRRRLTREIKTGSGPEGAIDPRFRAPPVPWCALPCLKYNLCITLIANPFLFILDD